MALLNEVLLTIKYNKTQAINETQKLVNNLSNKAQVNLRMKIDSTGALKQVQSTINSLNKVMSSKTKLKLNVDVDSRSSNLTTTTNRMFKNISKQFDNFVYTPISKSFSGIGSLFSKLGYGFNRTITGVGRTVKTVLSDINGSLSNVGNVLTGIFNLIQRIGYATVASMFIFGTYKVLQSMTDTTSVLLQNLKEIYVMIGNIDNRVLPVIRNTATQTGVEIDKIISSYQQLISVGYDVSEANDIIFKSTQAAMTTFTEDVSSVVDSVIRTYNVMGKKVGDTEQVLGKMFAAVKYGAFTFDEMAKNLGSILSFGSIAGAKFEEVLAAFSVASFSQEASEAATSLRNLFSDITESLRDELDIINELSKLSNTWSDSLKRDTLKQRLVFSKYGISITNAKGELVSFSELLDQVIEKYNQMSDSERMVFIKDLSLKLRSAPAFISLIQNAEKYRDILNNIYTDSDKAYNKAIETATKNPIQILKTINQAIVASLNIFGVGLLERFTTMFENIKIASQSFVKVMEDINKTSKTPTEFFRNSVLMFYQYMKYIISIMPIGVRSVMNFIGTFLMFGIAIKVFKLVTSVIGGFVNFVTKALLFLTSPFGIVLSLVMLLYSGWRYNWLGLRDIIKEISPTISDFFTMLLDRLAEAIMDFNSNEAKTIHEYFNKLKEIWKDKDMTLGEKIFASLGATVKTVLDTITNLTSAFLTFLGVPKERRDEFVKTMHDYTTEIETYINKIGTAKTNTEKFGAAVGTLKRIMEYPAKLFIEGIEAVTGIKFTDSFKERLQKGITLVGTFATGMILTGSPTGGLALSGAYLLITALDEALNNKDYTTLAEKIIGGLKAAIETLESPAYIVAKMLKIGENFGEDTEKDFITGLTTALGLAAGAITGNFKTGITIAAVYLAVKGFTKLTEGFESGSFKDVLGGISELLFGAGLLAMSGLKTLDGKYALMLSVGLMLLDKMLPQEGSTFDKVIDSAIKVLNVYGFTWSKKEGQTGYVAAATILALSGAVNNVTNWETAVLSALAGVTGFVAASKINVDGVKLDKSSKALLAIYTILAVQDVAKLSTLDIASRMMSIIGSGVTIGLQAGILSGNVLFGISIALVVTDILFAVNLFDLFLEWLNIKSESNIAKPIITPSKTLQKDTKQFTELEKQFYDVFKTVPSKFQSSLSKNLTTNELTKKYIPEITKEIPYMFVYKDIIDDLMRVRNILTSESSIDVKLTGINNVLKASTVSKTLAPNLITSLQQIANVRDINLMLELIDTILNLYSSISTLLGNNMLIGLTQYSATTSDQRKKIENVINEINKLPKKQIGGYTANVGEYEVAGVVHGGEWVAPKWMVEHPLYGALIGKLEEERKIRRGYRTGGLVSTIPQFRLGTYVPETKKYVVKNYGEIDIPEQITTLPQDKFEKYLDLLDKSITIQQELNKVQNELTNTNKKQLSIGNISNTVKSSVDVVFDTIAKTISNKTKLPVTSDLPKDYDIQEAYENNLKRGLSPSQSLISEVLSQTLTTFKEFFGGSIDIVSTIVDELSKTIEFKGVFDIDDSDIQNFEKLLELAKQSQEIEAELSRIQLDSLNKDIEEYSNKTQELINDYNKLTDSLNNNLISLDTNTSKLINNMFLLSKIYNNLSSFSQMLFKDETTRNNILNAMFGTLVNVMTQSYITLQDNLGTFTGKLFDLTGELFGRNEIIINSLNEAMLNLLLTSEEMSFLFETIVKSLKLLLMLDVLSQLFKIDIEKQNWNIVNENKEGQRFELKFDIDNIAKSTTNFINNWKQIFGNIMTNTANVIETTFKTIVDVGSNIFGFLMNVAEGTKEIDIGKIFSNFVNMFNDIINNVGNIASKVGNFFDIIGKSTDKVLKIFGGDEETLNNLGISKSDFEKMNTQDKLSVAINSVIGDFSQLGTTLPVVIGAISLLAYVLKPIVEGIMNVVQPLIDSVLTPLNNILMVIGKTIGTMLLPLLGPITSVIRLLLTGFAYLVSTVSWVVDQFVLAINAFLEWLPFVNGFLTEQQKKEMSKNIQERVNDIMGEPVDNTSEGDTIGNATAHEVHNYFNIYIEDNMILSKDDKQLQYLAELIYQYLKPKLSS